MSSINSLVIVFPSLYPSYSSSTSTRQWHTHEGRNTKVIRVESLPRRRWRLTLNGLLKLNPPNDFLAFRKFESRITVPWFPGSQKFEILQCETGFHDAHIRGRSAKQRLSSKDA